MKTQMHCEMEQLKEKLKEKEFKLSKVECEFRDMTKNFTSTLYEAQRVSDRLLKEKTDLLEAIQNQESPLLS